MLRFNCFLHHPRNLPPVSPDKTRRMSINYFCVINCVTTKKRFTEKRIRDLLICLVVLTNQLVYALFCSWYSSEVAAAPILYDPRWSNYNSSCKDKWLFQLEIYILKSFTWQNQARVFPCQRKRKSTVCSIRLLNRSRSFSVLVLRRNIQYRQTTS